MREGHIATVSKDRAPRGQKRPSAAGRENKQKMVSDLQSGLSTSALDAAVSARGPELLLDEHRAQLSDLMRGNKERSRKREMTVDKNYLAKPETRVSDEEEDDEDLKRKSSSTVVSASKIMKRESRDEGKGRERFSAEDELLEQLESRIPSQKETLREQMKREKAKLAPRSPELTQMLDAYSLSSTPILTSEESRTASGSSTTSLSSTSPHRLAYRRRARDKNRKEVLARVENLKGGGPMSESEKADRRAAGSRKKRRKKKKKASTSPRQGQGKSGADVAGSASGTSSANGREPLSAGSERSTPREHFERQQARSGDHRSASSRGGGKERRHHGGSTRNKAKRKNKDEEASSSSSRGRGRRKKEHKHHHHHRSRGRDNNTQALVDAGYSREIEKLRKERKEYLKEIALSNLRKRQIENEDLKHQLHNLKNQFKQDLHNMELNLKRDEEWKNQMRQKRLNDLKQVLDSSVDVMKQQAERVDTRKRLKDQAEDITSDFEASRLLQEELKTIARSGQVGGDQLPMTTTSAFSEPNTSTFIQPLVTPPLVSSSGKRIANLNSSLPIFAANAEEHKNARMNMRNPAKHDDQLQERSLIQAEIQQLKQELQNQQKVYLSELQSIRAVVLPPADSPDHVQVSADMRAYVFDLGENYRKETEKLKLRIAPLQEDLRLLKLLAAPPGFEASGEQLLPASRGGSPGAAALRVKNSPALTTASIRSPSSPGTALGSQLGGSRPRQRSAASRRGRRMGPTDANRAGRDGANNANLVPEVDFVRSQEDGGFPGTPKTNASRVVYVSPVVALSKDSTTSNVNRARFFSPTSRSQSPGWTGRSEDLLLSGPKKIHVEKFEPEKPGELHATVHGLLRFEPCTPRLAKQVVTNVAHLDHSFSELVGHKTRAGLFVNVRGLMGELLGSTAHDCNDPRVLELEENLIHKAPVVAGEELLLPLATDLDDAINPDIIKNPPLSNGEIKKKFQEARRNLHTARRAVGAVLQLVPTSEEDVVGEVLLAPPAASSLSSAPLFHIYREKWTLPAEKEKMLEQESELKARMTGLEQVMRGLKEQLRGQKKHPDEEENRPGGLLEEDPKTGTSIESERQRLQLEKEAAVRLLQEKQKKAFSALEQKFSILPNNMINDPELQVLERDFETKKKNWAKSWEKCHEKANELVQVEELQKQNPTDENTSAVNALVEGLERLSATERRLAQVAEEAERSVLRKRRELERAFAIEKETLEKQCETEKNMLEEEFKDKDKERTSRGLVVSSPRQFFPGEERRQTTGAGPLEDQLRSTGAALATLKQEARRVGAQLQEIYQAEKSWSGRLAEASIDEVEGPGRKDSGVSVEKAIDGAVQALKLSHKKFEYWNHRFVLSRGGLRNFTEAKFQNNLLSNGVSTTLGAGLLTTSETFSTQLRKPDRGDNSFSGTSTGRLSRIFSPSNRIDERSFYLERSPLFAVGGAVVSRGLVSSNGPPWRYSVWEVLPGVQSYSSQSTVAMGADATALLGSPSSSAGIYNGSNVTNLMLRGGKTRNASAEVFSGKPPLGGDTTAGVLFPSTSMSFFSRASPRLHEVSGGRPAMASDGAPGARPGRGPPTTGGSSSSATRNKYSSSSRVEEEDEVESGRLRRQNEHTSDGDGVLLQETQEPDEDPLLNSLSINSELLEEVRKLDQKGLAFLNDETRFKLWGDDAAVSDSFRVDRSRSASLSPRNRLHDAATPPSSPGAVSSRSAGGAPQHSPKTSPRTQHLLQNYKDNRIHVDKDHHHPPRGYVVVTTGGNGSSTPPQGLHRREGSAAGSFARSSTTTQNKHGKNSHTNESGVVDAESIVARLRRVKMTGTMDFVSSPTTRQEVGEGEATAWPSGGGDKYYPQQAAGVVGPSLKEKQLLSEEERFHVKLDDWKRDPESGRWTRGTQQAVARLDPTDRAAAANSIKLVGDTSD
ncbi:unnamed protein product [Amoebophrya sp. A120]|nr:unnamed protein product [Amoebophrya sp. A120]|eukprot:GSA120T00004525001.1